MLSQFSPRPRRLPHSVVVRAPGLLPMLYTLSELTEELRVSRAVIRGWLKRGLAHERDSRGHILVKWKSAGGMGDEQSGRESRLETRDR